MFKLEINSILKDLDNHSRDKSSLLTYYVNKRLDKCLMTYYNQLTSSCNSILNSYDLCAKNIKKVVSEVTKI